MTYRLPDRTNTEDVDLYCQSWIKIADQVIELLPDLKLKHFAFDPGIQFLREDWKYNNILTLDTDLCNAIIKLGNHGKENR